MMRPCRRLAWLGVWLLAFLAGCSQSPYGGCILRKNQPNMNTYIVPPSGPGNAPGPLPPPVQPGFTTAEPQPDGKTTTQPATKPGATPADDTPPKSAPGGLAPQSKATDQNQPPRISFMQPATEAKKEVTVAAFAGATGEADAPAPGPRAEKQRPGLVDALHCMLEDRHQEALQHLQRYDQETQEFFLRILPTFAIFAKKKFNEVTSQEAGVLTEQLHSLLTSLRTKTELTIDTMCYCEWIKAYGIYRPLRENHAFLASSPGRPGDLVQLYVELRNFASEPREGSFETRLSSSVEIRDAKGNVRRTLAFDDNKQPLKSLTRLSDYFNNYSFYVPPELEPGCYQLTIQIVDETFPDARRVARKSLEFRVTTTAGQAVPH
jgi:hypothetical protein